jgi:hypothetical protein
VANRPDLDGKSGEFEVQPSELPGKLRKHPQDPRQFAYDDGQWFLHLGDTGYRYVTATEPLWQQYIDEAAQVGFNKIRTWFCSGRHDVAALFAKDRQGLDLAYWDEIERRLVYALEKYPHIQFQLIPYGEDWPELVPLRRRATGPHSWWPGTPRPASRLFPTSNGAFRTMATSRPPRAGATSHRRPSIASGATCGRASPGARS